MNKTQKHRQAVSYLPAAAANGDKALALAAELRGLAADLERQANGEATGFAVALTAFAGTVAAARRELDRAIGTPWLTDPALELLLCAFVSEQAGSPTGSEGAIAAVPHTAQRWVAVLEQAGLLAEGSEHGALTLTPTGRLAVCRYLETLSGHGPSRSAV